MNELFENKRDFNDDMSKWNVSAVTNMSSMFHDAAAFKTDMMCMFSEAAFNQPLEEWNVSVSRDGHEVYLFESSSLQPVA